MTTILIIEDEPSILLGLENAMLKAGYEILIARDGRQGLKFALQEKVDLVILDLMLPTMDGLEVLRQLRKQDMRTPVIILTAKGQEADKIKGFKRGADDYIVKPFSVKELKARVAAILKRCQPAALSTEQVTIEGMEFDFKAMRAQGAGQAGKFTTRELELLKVLVQCQGEVVSRERILEAVWGYQPDAAAATRSVDNYIVRLRKKIEPDPNQPVHIITVHGLGYRFQA